MAPRPLPSNHEAERCVLGAILLDAGALDRVTTIIDPEDLHLPSHQAVYRAMLSLRERNTGIDPVTIEATVAARGEQKIVGGIEFVSSLSDRYAITHNVEDHARLVRAAATQRRLIEVCRGIATEAYGEIEDLTTFTSEAEAKVAAAIEGGRVGTLRTAKEVVPDAFRRVIDAGKRGEVTGLPTGLYSLDRMTSGLQPGDLVIVAARPSMGKTAFALGMAERVLFPYQRENRPRCPVLIFSMEMTAEELMKRLMGTRSRVDSAQMRSGQFDEHSLTSLIRACEEIAACEDHFLVDDGAAPRISDMRAIARRWKSNMRIFGPDAPTGMIIVDYLQLARGSKSKYGRREEEVSEISRGLKAMAKECSCPVVALSQLNRGVDSRDDHRPRLSDLRESGAIEQDADAVMFLYRPEVYVTGDDDEAEQKRIELEGRAEIILAKQRNGPIGTCNAVFVKRHIRFANPERQD